MGSRTRILLTLGMLMSLPAFAQTNQDETTADVPAENHTAMMVPPPVSETPYATKIGDEDKQNFVRMGLTTSGGYIRNLSPGSVGLNVNEATYLIEPAFEINRSTERLHSDLSYDASFAWYQIPNVVNTTDHNFLANVQYRLSPHVTLAANDRVLKMTTAFGQTTPTFQPTIGGTNQLLPVQIFGLFEPQVSNQSDTGVNWQYGRNDMVAGSGWVSTLRFTNPRQSGGLYNTDASGGSGSWIHRISLGQYVGGMYQYFWAQANTVTTTQPGSSETRGNSVFGFYTTYLQPRLSVSLQGGGQQYTVSQPLLPDYRAWEPAGNASMAWQGEHTVFVVSYGHVISAGEGVLDAFVANSVAASGKWQLARTWNAEVNAGYSTLSDVAARRGPGAIGSGHTLAGDAAISHNLTALLQLSCSYGRIHQTYDNIPSISGNPDSDRVLVSLTYSLVRGIGK